MLGVIAFGGQSIPADALIVRSGAASIHVPDQTGPWGTVTIDQVVTPAPSWVIVQAKRPDGAGPILGSARVPAGTSSNLAIALDPKQGAVNSLVVFLLADRGQQGVLEFSGTGAPGGGGMGMGGGSSQGAAGSAPATQSADKPLVAGGKRISVVVSEVSRVGVPGVVHRVVVP